MTTDIAVYMLTYVDDLYVTCVDAVTVILKARDLYLLSPSFSMSEENLTS